MATWLIYPPFADPTQPYLSLPYLKSCLKNKGFGATVLDLNVSAAHHLLGHGHIRECTRKIAGRFEDLNGQKKLSRFEAMEYVALADARMPARRLLTSGVLPVESFQDPGRFYDFGLYRQARNLAEDALTCTSAASFPFQFHFNRATHLGVPWSPDLLESYFQNRQSPLDGFYSVFFKDWPVADKDVVGINLTFISQIPEAFYLAQMLRQMKPAVFIVLGGSCLQQMLSHGTEASRRWVVTVADAACLLEGEETLPKLLQVLGRDISANDKDMHWKRLGEVPNLLFREPGGKLQTGPMHVSDLTSLPGPDYSDLDLDGYLAPERTLLFAPTRGCYWNRCAFCDYGLNRSQCHGYREMAADEAAIQLVRLSNEYGVRNFYFSVDVMAPKFVLDLARALIRRQADIRWSADFRMENYYTAERLAILYQSGLRAVAFGVESGSERVLKKMDKGISVPLIRKVNARFHQAGIATAWMTFSGHPGESVADALETTRLIEQEQNRIGQFILGNFGLTSGSLIAANPRQFGLKNVFYCRGDSFCQFPLYETGQPPKATPDDTLEKTVDRLSRAYFLDHYPWAGAISTHHSFLYVLKYGQQVFRSLAFSDSGKKGPPLKKSNLSLPPGLTLRPKFPIERLDREHQQAMQTYFQNALARTQDGMAPLDHNHFMRYLGAGNRK
ncbi:MAG: radical SAM protein [Proteobacteria bacterium]|nr:radical SAM protein [Pseudomonadota bacterium]